MTIWLDTYLFAAATTAASVLAGSLPSHYFSPCLSFNRGIQQKPSPDDPRGKEEDAVVVQVVELIWVDIEELSKNVLHK